MPKFMIVMCICGIFAKYCYSIAGHPMGALSDVPGYLKTKTHIMHLRFKNHRLIEHIFFIYTNWSILKYDWIGVIYLFDTEH